MDPKLKRIAAGTLSFLRSTSRVSRRITSSLGIDYRLGAIISAVVFLTAFVLVLSLVLTAILTVLVPLLLAFALAGLIWGGGVAVRNYVAAFRSSVSP